MMDAILITAKNFTIKIKLKFMSHVSWVAVFAMIKSSLFLLIFASLAPFGMANEEWILAQAPMDSPYYREVLKQMFPEYFAEIERVENEVQGRQKILGNSRNFQGFF